MIPSKKKVVADFNLMLKGGASGLLTHHAIKYENAATFSADTGPCFVYIAGESVALSDGSVAKSGDLVQIIQENGLRPDGGSGFGGTTCGAPLIRADCM